MIFNQVDKVVRQDHFNIVKFQILTHCFLNNITLNKTELDCLALLGCRGKIQSTKFCALAAEAGILGTPAAVHTCLSKVERSNLFLKQGVGKKFLFLNPELGIQTEGNIILNFKFVYADETSPLEGVSQKNGATVEFA